MIVIGLKSKKTLIEEVSIHFDATSIYIASYPYSDGECQFQFEQPFSDQNILIIFDLYPHPHQKCFQLLSILHLINQQVSNAQIILVCPYFPFLRESKISSIQSSQIDTLLHHLKLNNVTKIVTIDTHNEQYFKNHSIAIINIIPYSTFLDSFLSTHYPPILVAPDKGAHQKIVELSHDKKLPYILCHKDKSKNHTEIFQTNLTEHAPHQTYLILDDICDTADTLLLTIQLLQQYNPQTIHIWTTHGIFTNFHNLKALLKNLDGVFFTSDSIIQESDQDLQGISRLSLSPLIIDVLSKIKLF